MSDRADVPVTPGDSGVKLLGPAEIRDLAGILNIVPTKKLGQNFVIDPNTVRRIVRVAGVKPGETVVEVGPGLGSLTFGLLEAGAAVVAVEIDGSLAAQLPKTAQLMAPDASLTVIHEDALRITELPDAPARLVANLPYNVSVPVLLHFMEHFPTLLAGVVMVQAEVGYRIAAEPGSKVYGAPSVKAEWYGSWRTHGQVSRQIFWPVPNVDSVLVGFDRREVPLGTEEERLATFSLVDAGFQQRRKMLRQSLQPVLGDTATASAIIEEAGVNPETRSEQLTVRDFLNIARVSVARS